MNMHSPTIGHREGSNQSSLIKLQHVGFEFRVDSRVIAGLLNNQHKNVLALLLRYQSDFEEFGTFAFQTRKSGGRETKFVLLNRSQSELLLTYSSNTPESRRLKVGLIKAFDKARNTLEASGNYIPFYHAVHEDLQAVINKSGSTTPAKIHHMNLEKLLNKVFGLTPGTRQQQPIEIRLMIGSAMALASRVYKQALANGQDHKIAYKSVKTQLEGHLSMFTGPKGLKGVSK
ncbi:MAG: Rha family transcriptional regulator [Oceanospirillaceae bacterium]|nr:Rha family transcriptional regulator [Oceanospirillaceae bacterium]